MVKVCIAANRRLELTASQIRGCMVQITESQKIGLVLIQLQSAQETTNTH